MVKHCKRGPEEGRISNLALQGPWLEQPTPRGPGWSSRWDEAPLEAPSSPVLAASFPQRERRGGTARSRRHRGGRGAQVRRPAGGNPMHNARKICSVCTDVGVSVHFCINNCEETISQLRIASIAARQQILCVSGDPDYKLDKNMFSCRK